MTKFKYPPCRINPDTDKPYTRHKWIIPTVTRKDGMEYPKVRWYEVSEDDGFLVYHVICERCKFRDPNPARY